MGLRLPLNKGRSDRGRSDRGRSEGGGAPFAAPAAEPRQPAIAQDSDVAWLQQRLVMVSLALYAGLLLGLAFVSTVTGPPSYAPIFAAAWVILPAAGLAAALVLDRLVARKLGGHPLFFPALLIGNAAFPLLVSPLLLPLTYQVSYLPEPLDQDVIPGLLTERGLAVAYALWCPLVLVGIVRLLRTRGAELRDPLLVGRAWQVAYALTPVSVALMLLHFAPIASSLIWPQTTLGARLGVFATALLLAVVLTAGLVLGPRLAQSPGVARAWALAQTRWARWAFTLALVLAIVVVVVDVRLPRDLYHQFSFLVPIHAITLGRTPLIDVSSGNGILVVFFFAWLFQLFNVPHTAQGLTLVNSGLIVVELIGLYVLLKLVTRSMGAAVLGIGAIVWAYLLSAPMQVNWYTQHGPSRFGIPYLYLLLCALRYRHPRLGWLYLTLEHLVLGVASIWMLEAFLYVFVAYQAVTVYEAYMRASSIRRVAVFLLLRALAFFAAVAICHLALTVLVYSRAGQLPDWSQYLVVFGSVAGGQNSTWAGRRIPLWTPWALFLATYGVSLLAIMAEGLRRRRAGASWEQMIVLAMTVCGCLQFSYHILVAYPYSLHPVVIPAVFVAVYWGHRLWAARARLPASFWVPALGCFWWGLLIVGVAMSERALDLLGGAQPRAVAGIVVSALTGRTTWAATQFQDRLHGTPSTPDVIDALELIAKYRRPDEARLGIFLFDGIATSEALMRLGTLHALPMDYPTQDSLHALWRRRSLDSPTPFRLGDTIYVHPGTGNYLERRVVRSLCEQFDLQALETSANGVAALRLTPLGDSQFGPWCARHFAPFVTSARGEIYAMERGTRRLIPDADTFTRLAGTRPDPRQLVRLTDQVLDALPLGTPLPPAAEHRPFIQIGDNLYATEADANLLQIGSAPAYPALGGLDDKRNVLFVTDGDERYWITEPIFYEVEVRSGRVFFGLDTTLRPVVRIVVI